MEPIPNPPAFSWRAMLVALAAAALILVVPLALPSPVPAADAPPRVLLAASASLGVLLTYGFVAHFAGPRAGAYAAIALATMPLYFVAPWAALKSAISMAAFAASFGGVVVATSRGTLLTRAVWLGIGVAGTAVAWWSAGPLAGACVPLLAAAFSWILARSNLFGGIVAALAMALAIAAGAFGAEDFAAHAKDAGFDAVFGQLGHALAPWSALAPFAIAGLAVDKEDETRSLSTALLVGTGLAVFTYGWLGASATFAATPIVAAACGLALQRMEARVREREAEPLSLAVAVGITALLFVLYRDFKALPEKALAPIGAQALDLHDLPPGFKPTSALLFAAALGVFAVALLSTCSRARDVRGRARFTRVITAAARAWNGAATALYLFLLVSLIAAYTLVLVGTRVGLKWALGVSAFGRDLLLYGLVLIVAFPIALVVVPVLQDAGAYLIDRRLGGRRGMVIAAAGLVAGAILALRHYPALASEVSPKYALDAYTTAKKNGDEIALLGVPAKTAHLDDARVFPSADGAAQWLLEKTDARRFLAFGSDTLAALNPLFRAQAHANLPVLDAQSSRILLAASRLEDGEASQNPLDPFVVDSAPAPDHLTPATLGEEVEVLGFDLRDANGARIETMVPGRPARMRVYFHPLKRPTTAWQVFIHVDGHGRRETADHPPVGGRYPATSWLPGDTIIDEHDVVLGGNFTPGTYHLYFGLFVGENRLKATKGQKDGDGRVDGGDILVR